MNWVYTATLMLLVFVALLSGCAVPLMGEYGPIGHSREDLEHYVEEVFRFQNNITSEVMMLLENGGIKNRDLLLQSEEHMHQVCEPLNVYVSRDIDGLSTSLRLRRQVLKSTLACDHAAHEVKALLEEE